MNKVAKVTFTFWILKILATTLGETAGDQLSKTMQLGYGVSSLILIAAFAVSVLFQVGSSRFHPVLFWTVILTTSTAGTTMSDYMDRTLDLGYALGTCILVTGLATVLAVWRWREGTLSVSLVGTKRAEAFYWTAILFSNTLGTALGDFLADDSGLGFMGGAAVVGGALALVALAYRLTTVNRVVLFWIAFVLTRPFGATFGDVLARPVDEGCLGYGTAASSAILAGLLVAVLAVDVIRSRRAEAGSGPFPA